MYDIGVSGCNVWKDGESLMAIEVLALLEQRDRIVTLLNFILLTLESGFDLETKDIHDARNALNRILQNG